jgi:internalin A
MSMKFRLNTILPGIPTWFIARSHRFTIHTPYVST